MAVRIRGRSIEAGPTATVTQWDRAVTTLLETAVRYGTLDERVTKQRSWLDRHPDHPTWLERKQTMHRTTVARNEVGGRLADLAADVDRVHRSLPDGSRGGLAALAGHELWPGVPSVWAMTAARMQTTDVFAVAARVLMELRAEDEADADIEATAHGR